MRYIFCLFFILFISNEINSQIIKSIGLESGVSITNQKIVFESSNSLPDYIYDNRIGPDIFLTVEGPSSKRLSLITIFGYVPKGFKSEFENINPNSLEGDGTYSTYDNRYDFLSLSPMVKCRFELGPFIPNLFIGPRLDLLISHELDMEYGSNRNFNEFILGLNLGLGLEYKFNSVGLFIQSYYQPDLTPLSSHKLTKHTIDHLYNRAFIINLGVKYYFKTKTVQEVQ